MPVNGIRPDHSSHPYKRISDVTKDFIALLHSRHDISNIFVGKEAVTRRFQVFIQECLQSCQTVGNCTELDGDVLNLFVSGPRICVESIYHSYTARQ